MFGGSWPQVVRVKLKRRGKAFVGGETGDSDDDGGNWLEVGKERKCN